MVPLATALHTVSEFDCKSMHNVGISAAGNLLMLHHLALLPCGTFGHACAGAQVAANKHPPNCSPYSCSKLTRVALATWQPFSFELILYLLQNYLLHEAEPGVIGLGWC